MDKESFEKNIYQNWTQHFGQPVETARKHGTTLSPEKKYEGDKIVVLEYIGKHTFIQLDPSYFEALSDLVKRVPAKLSINGDHIRRVWSEKAIQSHHFGKTYYLYPPDLPPYTPVAPFYLRKLTEADRDAMSILHADNTPEDVDEGFVEVTHQIAFGCFLDKQLVAASSGYERTGFLDIGVLTHPEFRKMGLGKAVVGVLCDWAAQNNIIAQYRHDAENINSQKVALSLNFKIYFTTEAITFR